MNERHEGKHLRRQEAKKRWKTILAVFLSVVLVMQSSNIQAFADVLASGGSEGRDEVVMDPAAEDTGTQGEVTTPEETNTADEQASSQDDAEQTVAETEENPVETTAQDTEATTPDGQSDQAQSEQAPAEETDTTVTLNVEVSAATLKYSAQDGTEKSVTSETDPKSVDVTNTLDFTFTVAPDDGQQVSSVAYAGAALTANDSGEYTIDAADLTDGEKIVVTTEAVPTEEPAEGATPVETEETTEPTEDEATTTEDTAESEDSAANNGISLMANSGRATVAPGVESDGIMGGSGDLNDPWLVAPGTVVYLQHDYERDASWRITTGQNVTAVLQDVDNGSAGRWYPFVGTVGARDASVTLRFQDTAVSGYNLNVGYGNTYYCFRVADGRTLNIDWGVDGIADETSKFYGDTLTFPSCTQSVEGKSFAGWKVEGDASGTVYQPGQTYQVAEETELVTIIAQWNTAFSISPTNNVLERSQTVQLQASPSEWQNEIKWSSSDPDVATVDESGKVTAVSSGVATITAIADGKGANGEALTATTRVYVKDQNAKVVDAYFYFALPGKSSTSTDVHDYMYAGAGTIAIPDGFDYTTSASRWYNGDWHNGSRFNLDGYVVTPPSDEAIRKGLETYYNGENGRDKYDPSWTYTIEWTTMVGNTDSVGYDYKGLSPYTIPHVDCRITVNTEDTATLAYEIRQPDGSLVTNSTVHDKGDRVDINSTVQESGNFQTDGYEYSATKQNGGTNYYFDGWYTDSNYTIKAPDHIDSVNSSDVFYARYVAEKHALTFDAEGGQFANSNGTRTEEHAYRDEIDLDDVEVPTREGYDFVGWVDEDGEAVDGTYTMPNRDATLHAQWKQTLVQGDQITVEVYLNGTKVNAQDYIELASHKNSSGADATTGFVAAPSGDDYTVDFTYAEFNCADIDLDLIAAISGDYDVEISSSINITDNADGSDSRYYP